MSQATVPSPRLSVLRAPTEILGEEAVRHENKSRIYYTHKHTQIYTQYSLKISDGTYLTNGCLCCGNPVQKTLQEKGIKK